MAGELLRELGVWWSVRFWIVVYRSEEAVSGVRRLVAATLGGWCFDSAPSPALPCPLPTCLCPSISTCQCRFFHILQNVTNVLQNVHTLPRCLSVCPPLAHALKFCMRLHRLPAFLPFCLVTLSYFSVSRHVTPSYVSCLTVWSSLPLATSYAHGEKSMHVMR